MDYGSGNGGGSFEVDKGGGHWVENYVPSCFLIAGQIGDDRRMHLNADTVDNLLFLHGLTK
jgi:hypothetical protein